MAKYRKIDPRIWNDAKFRRLSDNGKLVFLFVLTHPHQTALGAMRASFDGLAAELNWTRKAFREAFGEGLREGLLKASPKACFIWAPNFLKYNKPESPNVVKAWRGAWDLLPECPLLDALYQQVKAFAEGLGEGFREAFGEAFGKAFAKASPYQEPEPEPEPEPESPLNPPKGDWVEIEEIVKDLNQVVGKHFRVGSKKTQSLIRARLAEGYSLEHFQRVHRIKASQWLDDYDRDKFLRPETLYRAGHFESYLNENPNLSRLKESEREFMRMLGITSVGGVANDIFAADVPAIPTTGDGQGMGGMEAPD